MAAGVSTFGSHQDLLAGDARELASLLEIGKALSGTSRLKAGITEALEILERHHGAFRSAVTLLREGSQELCIEASVGLNADGQAVRYQAGEGVTGRVVQTGKPVVLPQASREPTFLNRAGQRRYSSAWEITFICVPIVVHRKPLGSLSVDLAFNKDRDYERTVNFFGVVASIIAQAIQIHCLIDADRRRLLEENVHLREELRERYDFSNLIGNSGPIRRVYEQVTQVASTGTTVMLRGESGTGKELIAHAIHYNSPRRNCPFIKVNCAALPETLIESELFGYEKGAFTGAQSQKKGRFELAEGGTLFLDEIGDLNASTAVKLLRVLQEKEFDRLGGTRTIKADVRLIVATNKNLEKAISAGAFREDLYYRLNVFAIFVPPLRERKSDVLLLADHFLEEYSNQHGKNIKRISTPAIDMLMSYHWPGNIRELENAVERAVLVCDGNVIHGHHLPPTLQTAEASGTVTNVSFKEAVEAYEKDLIQDTLKTTRGNRAKAANLLKTTDRVISYKVKKLKIDCGRFRS
ncbi:MAG TPA: sigma 54-interacting transcriptional regulator [Candidatus Acidoferrales bacterium]|jgi:Nif-specific regulatory protein|nr:sigma 54-interacting transcriptional regulator [Candidatus Acidoferrales bacterium]